MRGPEPAGHDRAGRAPAGVVAEHRAQGRLIVYGSLAPGREHHDQLAGLAGEWRDGWVTGVLHDRGWGAGLGYPALEWRARGPRVTAKLFTSPDLPAHWPRLDRFEGPDYRRIVAPFHELDGSETLAHVYVLRSSA